MIETKVLDHSIPMADILPDTLGELVAVALQDEDQAFKSREYRIEMEMWHQPVIDSQTDTGVCYVCFAGAVMAYELGIRPTEAARPRAFRDRSVYRKLMALDEIRKGNIDYAYQNFHDLTLQEAAKALEARQIPLYVEVHPYDVSRTVWRRNISLIARILKKGGI